MLSERMQVTECHRKTKMDGWVMTHGPWDSRLEQQRRTVCEALNSPEAPTLTQTQAPTQIGGFIGGLTLACRQHSV